MDRQNRGSRSEDVTITIKGNTDLAGLNGSVEGRAVFEGHLRHRFREETDGANLMSVSLDAPIDGQAPTFTCIFNGPLSDEQQELVAELNGVGFPEAVI